MNVVGIDLGTTNSVVAVVVGRDRRVIKTRSGSTLTPSAVTSVEKIRGSGHHEVKVGRDAVANAGRDPVNTIFSIKRLMGRIYHEPWTVYEGQITLDDVARHVSYTIAPPPESSDDHGVKVLLNGKPHSPVEISSLILQHIKAEAEHALGKPVTHAVITVPAYFTSRQRDATRDAGRLAGLEVLGILDEPSAAALAFGATREDSKHRVLVYDLGGGTFDISIIQMKDGKYAQVRTEGDNWLGGDDFDRTIIKRLARYVQEDAQVDLSRDKNFLARAKELAEQAKIELSTKDSVNIVKVGFMKLPAPQSGQIDIDMPLTRKDFEDDIRPLVARTIERVQAAMEKSSLTPKQITEVLLVGGSTRVPLVRQTVIDLFGADKVRDSVDPMECVALGAALHAATFQPTSAPTQATSRQSSPLLQKIARPLGIAVRKGNNPDAFAIIIPEQTLYPLAEPRRQMFYPTEDNQTLIKVPVFQGDSELASLNEQQGVVEFRLPEGIREGTGVEIGLNYDSDGTITVEVRIDGANMPPFRETLRRDRPVAPKTLTEDWRETLAPWIKAGQHMRDLYGTYMERDDFDELVQAIKDAEQAVRRNEGEAGERLSRTLHHLILGSGVASQLFLAERAQNSPCATVEERATLGRAVARLKIAAKKPDGKAEVDAIMRELRPKVAEVFARDERGPRLEGRTEAERGMVTVKDLGIHSPGL
jgi:molecular chaperone DnaK